MLSSRVRAAVVTYGAFVVACGLTATGSAPETEMPPPVDTLPAIEGGTPVREAGSPATQDAASEASPEGGCTNPAFVFDGDATVSAPDDSLFDFKPSYTVEAWVRPDQTSSEMDIVSHHDPNASEGFVLLINSGRVEMRTYGKNGANAPKVIVAGDIGQPYVVAGVWMHVAAVLTSDTLAVFVNGERKAVAAVSDFTPRHSSLGVVLGRASHTEGFGFVGAIDEVRLSKIARYDPLSSSVARPDAPFVRDTDTITLWHLDEINGTTTPNDGNTSFNAKLGTSSFAPSRVDVPCIPNR
jgi:hypothetical protein